MSHENYCFKQLDKNNAAAIMNLFVSVFTAPPWNDDWSDKNQLQLYIHDLISQPNSLTFGCYLETELIGVSMGQIRHWYSGTEYYINELLIKTSVQRKGIGTWFIGKIEKACKELGLVHLFLLTEKGMPAYEFYKKQNFLECTDCAAFTKKIQ